MKFISLALVYLFFINTAISGLPPTSLKSQNGTKSTTFNFEVPNSQATKTSTGGLIETGNSNILVNPSFEHATFNTGWTCTGITPVAETSIVASGAKAMTLAASASTFECYQDSTRYATYMSGSQFLAMIRIYFPSLSGASLKVCSRNAGVTSATNCVDALNRTASKFNLSKIPFLSSTTSNGISIAGVSVTGNITLDDAFVGAVDLKQDVDQSRIAGESYFAGTTGCTWTRASTTIGAFTATAACPGPVVVRSLMGTWETTDANLPRQTITNLPAGKYKATFQIGVYNGGTGAAATMATITDGATTCEPVEVNNSHNVGGGNSVSCVFEYTSSGSRTFELHGAASIGSIIAFNDRTAPRTSMKFNLEYFGSGSVYSSTNADTDWASCGHTASDFTGFGTVTNIETQCKRQGGDLLMKGKFTSGTATAVEARLNLKLGGLALTSANTSKITSLQYAGSGASTRSDSNHVWAVLMEPSVGYATFNTARNTVSFFGKALANAIIASGDTVSIDARIPINGWENSNVIIGNFAEMRMVGARCINTSAQSIPNTGQTQMTCTSETYDTHSALSSAGTFTAPESAYYHACGRVLFDASTYAAANAAVGHLFKNGSLYSYLEYTQNYEAITNVKTVGGCDTLYLAAGETAGFYLSNGRTAGATLLNTSTQINYFEIEKVGSP